MIPFSNTRIPTFGIRSPTRFLAESRSRPPPQSLPSQSSFPNHSQYQTFRCRRPWTTKRISLYKTDLIDWYSNINRGQYSILNDFRLLLGSNPFLSTGLFQKCMRQQYANEIFISPFKQDARNFSRFETKNVVLLYEYRILLNEPPGAFEIEIQICCFDLLISPPPFSSLFICMLVLSKDYNYVLLSLIFFSVSLKEM